MAIFLSSCASPVDKDGINENLRLPAEYEPVRSLVLAWPVGMPELYPLYIEIIQAAIVEVPVALVVPTEGAASRVRTFLESEDASVLLHVHFLIAPTRSIWIRDYGPIYVEANDTELTMVDTQYSPRRSNVMDLENDIPDIITHYIQVPARKTPLVLDGGNLMSDGKGRCFTSTVLHTQNPVYSLEQITEELRSLFGCKKVEVFPVISGEPTGHIGLLIKILPNNIVLVGQCTTSNEDSCTTLDTISERITAIEAGNGSRYTVRRVPYPMVGLTQDSRVYASYINSVILNQTVLVPQFGLPYDEAVLELYQEALPSHHIVPIDTRPLRNLAGAIQCISITIPGEILESYERVP